MERAACPFARARAAIRRIGHVSWLRNLAIALGNAPCSSAAVRALSRRLDHASALVREHVGWALSRQLAQGRNIEP